MEGSGRCSGKLAGAVDVASLTAYGGRWALRRCSKVSRNVGEVPECYIYPHIIIIL